MKNLLTVSIGGLLGTLVIFLLLKSTKEPVSTIATPDLGFPGAASKEAGATIRNTMHENEGVKRQLAIARLEGFLLAVRRNRRLAR